MDYPVIIDGAEAGRLTVQQRGPRVVFDAFCPGKERLIRLSVYGQDGEEGYLGVMQPGEGGMYLHRELSRSRMSAMPADIVRAAPAGEKPAEPHVSPPAAEAAPEPEEPRPAGRDTLWHADTVGLLWAEEDGRNLCAVPQRLGICCSGQELDSRVIAGNVYRIFEYDAARPPFNY